MSSVTPSPLPERDHALYVRDMLGFCDAVLSYTAGHDLASFRADRMRYDATLRNLELIGEAATHVPDEVRALAPGLPWRQVVGTRNRLAHAYLGVEPDTVWLIVTRSAPDLRGSLLACRTPWAPGPEASPGQAFLEHRPRPARTYSKRRCRAWALGTLDSAMAWSKLARQPPRCTAKASR